MKKFTLTVASILISGMLLAQDFTPPSKAVQAFDTKYPNGTVQEWYEGMDAIECYFENDGIYGSAIFSDQGEWLYSEYTIEDTELPRSASELLKEDFDGYEIMDVTLTETPELTTYDVIIGSDETEEKRLLTFDKSGELIDEVVISMDDDSFE